MTETYRTDNLDLRYIGTMRPGDDIGIWWSKSPKLGDFFYSPKRDYIWVRFFPRRAGGWSNWVHWPINLDGVGRCWKWDGNVERPTLHPSLDVHDVWHGYIRAGVAESC